MNSFAVELMKRIQELKAENLDLHRNLVMDDAPKNRFSVITGKFLAFEAIEAEIRDIDTLLNP